MKDKLVLLNFWAILGTQCLFCNAKKSINSVQTFGHMEHVLKLEEFVSLREVENNPLSLCPTKPESFQLVQTMIDQIMTLHQGQIKVIVLFFHRFI